MLIFNMASTINATTTVTDVLLSSLSNPKVLVAVVIQLIMGFALGYLTVKVAKYILAFIGILVLGAILSVWSLGESVEETILNISSELQQVIPLVKDFLITLGILAAGPVTLGFILGLLVGLMRK